MLNRGSSVNKPKSLTILGIPYTITYCDKPSDVDINGRDSCWGSCDTWKREIRVYNADKIEDIWGTIIHEVLHAIVDMLKLSILDDEDRRKHDELDILATALNDTFIRNDLLRI